VPETTDRQVVCTGPVDRGLTYRCQFSTFSSIVGRPSLPSDPKFATNSLRVENREELIQILTEALMQDGREVWLERFRGKGWVFYPPVSAVEGQINESSFKRSLWADQQHQADL